MSESKNLWQRMNDVMSEVGKVSRDKFVQLNQSGAGYKAVTHDNVTSTIRPFLVKHGVFISVDQTDCKVETLEITKKGYKGAPDYVVNEYMATVYIEVTFFNVDNPSEQFKARGFSYAMDSSDKAPGKALSYAVKNVLLKNLMLESCDEEENRDFEKRNNYEPTNIVKKDGGVSISSTNDPSEKQMKMIFALTKKLNPEKSNQEINDRMANIKTSRQASDAIEKLQKQIAEK